MSYQIMFVNPYWLLYCFISIVSILLRSYIAYYEQYSEFDAFITTPDPSNPWVSDNTEFWDYEKTM